MMSISRGLPILLFTGTFGCRQATGLDDFKFLQCTPGEPHCVLPPEDCVAGVDTNGDTIPPAACTGEIAWVRSSVPDGPLTCPEGGIGGDFTIDPTRHLTALRSFGAWAGTMGTVRGSLGVCDKTACTLEAFAQDPLGEGVTFAPEVPCEDTALFGALARGERYAHAASALGSEVAVSSHRLGDGSFASRWSFTAPAKVTWLDMTALEAPLVAVGQSDHALLVEPDDALPTATFHRLPSAPALSVALARGALVMGGLATPGESDPCELGASAATAFVAKAKLAKGSSDPASPADITCEGFGLELDVGKETGAPSMRVVAGRDGTTPASPHMASRVCWAYVGNNATTKVRRLRAGCFDLEDAGFRWQEEGTIGSNGSGGVDLAMDPFGNVILAAVVDPSTPLVWGGSSLALAATDSPNVALMKLAGGTGKLVWAHIFASPAGNAREPHVSADDDGLVRLGVVSDGPALVAKGLDPLAASAGPVVHFVGVKP